MNPVGTIIWQEIDGQRTIADLVEAMAGRFGDVERQQLASDIEKFVESMVDAGLIICG